jgi:hypothetical protein
MQVTTPKKICDGISIFMPIEADDGLDLRMLRIEMFQ